MESYLESPKIWEDQKLIFLVLFKIVLNNRVNGWTFKFFIKGRKEGIIKSLVTALTNHLMSCLRIPKTVTKKLTSPVAQFWWSSGSNTRGMHWKSWEKLHIPKDEGGLGFKDLTNFNTTMLGKQFWSLIEKPNTLFSRVFKRRYFRNATPVEPVRSYSSSYGWCSIVSIGSLVSKWLIKSWPSISVWNDPWLPSTRPRPGKK